MNNNVCWTGRLLFSVGSIAATSAMADKAPTAEGAAFQVNAASLISPAVQSTAAAIAKDGSFVVTWTAQEGSDTALNVHARRFAGDGSALTQDILVNDASDANVGVIGTATDAKGNFVVVFGAGSTIKIRLFNADGSPAGDEFCLDSACSSNASGVGAAGSVHAELTRVWG